MRAAGLGGLAAIIGFAGSRARARAYSGLADDARRRGRSRRQTVGRVTRTRVRGMIERILGTATTGGPMRFNSETGRDFLVQMQNWLRREFRPGGEYTIEFEQARAHAIAACDTELLGEHVVWLLDVRDELESAMAAVDVHLDNREEYVRRMQAARVASEVTSEVLEQELHALAVDLDDAEVLTSRGMMVAGRYQSFLAVVTQTQVMLEEAIAVTDQRLASIDAYFSRPDPRCAGRDTP